MSDIFFIAVDPMFQSVFDEFNIPSSSSLGEKSTCHNGDSSKVSLKTGCLVSYANVPSGGEKMGDLVIVSQPMILMMGWI
ncbi:hypothetical protein M5689_020544 [Euphorbia peplus]|nr:hypothetical protein M5689_020544 [Euphorbia peplus]